MLSSLLEREADQLRREIRAIRSDLVTPESFPSVAQLQERLTRENRQTDLRLLTADLLTHSEVIDAIATEMRGVALAQAELGSTELTPEEESTLAAWSEMFRTYLADFDTTTIPVDEIELPITGRPRVEGYDDVGFQASASDVIRLRWAYALSLMRVSLDRGGRHPGLVLMDEPGQQEVESLPALIRFAANESGSQIIIVTSEPAENIRDWAAGLTLQLIEVGPLLLHALPGLGDPVAE